MHLARPLPLALLALASLGAGASLMPRAAEACSYAPLEPSAVRPQPNETNVPTNAHLWISGSGITAVTLEGGGDQVPVALTFLPSFPQPQFDKMYRARPSRPLLPSTLYKVTATSQFGASATYSFTTGPGESLEVPAVPRSLAVGLFRNPSLNSCIGGSWYTFSTPSVGAAFYELQQSTDDGATFQAIGYSTTSQFQIYGSEVPSPLFRVRPLAITGLGADEDSLPVEEVSGEPAGDRIGEPGEPVKPPEPKKGGGGCSTTGAGGSAPAVLLAMAVLGWVQWQRRKRGARSLADLGLG